MKLQILSDLHREFDSTIDIPDIGADVLVLAGDIDYAVRPTTLWLTNLSDRYQAVLYVPGNHEYYGGDIRIRDKHMEAFEQMDYYAWLWMNNQIIDTPNGQRFVGTPLWSDCRDNPVSMETVRNRINDFRHILFDGKQLTPQIMRDKLYKPAVKFLEKNVQSGDVVITHWPPTMLARHMDCPADAIADYFCAELSEFIIDREPQLWICGHTHYNVDFMLGKTRILSNQKGYPHDPSEGFNPEMIVEI